MIRFTKRKRILLYVLGLILSLVSIPVGNAIHDLGVIHTLGIILLLFVGAGIFWEWFGTKEKDPGKGN
jgi:hypothetical protein